MKESPSASAVSKTSALHKPTECVDLSMLKKKIELCVWPGMKLVVSIIWAHHLQSGEPSKLPETEKL